MAGAVTGLLAPRHAAPSDAPDIHAPIAVDPESARVFSGSTIRFRVFAGGAPVDGVIWSAVGPGSVDANGAYSAPRDAPTTSFVVATARRMAAAAVVTVTAPPPAHEALALVSCYDGGTVDVRDALTLSSLGTADTSGTAAGIAVDPARRIALLGDGDRIASFDAATATTSYSTAIAGARFSEVVLLANGYVAATDNNAVDGRAGVRIFRVGKDGVPRLAASAAAGDTPEGLAATRDGKTFYVTNVNGNSVMRFRFDGAGSAKRTGSAATGHRPFGVALDDKRGLLFVADNDTPTISGTSSRPGVDVYSLSSLRRVTTLTTGTPDALPLGVAVDASANRAFVTNEGDGTVAAYSIAPLRRIATLRSGRTPWLPSVDVAHRRLFVPNAMADSFSVYDERSLRPVALGVPTCGYPTAVAAL